jgi:hypothetical protein
LRPLELDPWLELGVAAAVVAVGAVPADVVAGGVAGAGLGVAVEEDPPECDVLG